MANTNTLTSANSVIMLAISGLYAAAQQLQGFDTEDIFTSDAVDAAETRMGVDGKLSAGWIPAAKRMTITLQSDSDSNVLFETWVAAELAAKEKYAASGVVVLPAISRSFTLIRGFLTSYPAMPDARKILQPRKYVITWEDIYGVPT